MNLVDLPSLRAAYAAGADPAAVIAAFVALSLGRDAEAWGVRLGPGPYRLLHAAFPVLKPRVDVFAGRIVSAPRPGYAAQVSSGTVIITASGAA